jgi:geranylgeranyl reductase family protein
MKRCDVIVVGGGPAGSACAHDLVRAGADVALVDQARFPRDKCCAGWITPHVVSALELDLDDYAAGRTLQTIRGFATGAVGGQQITTDFAETISYAIRRCEFDHYLLQRSGASLTLGTPVRRLSHDADTWVVDDRVSAPMLVGAGGHFCPVGRHLNAGTIDGPVVVAQEIEFRMTGQQAHDCPVESEIPELFFCADRRGYGWCVRKGEYLNVGFGRLRGDDFHRHARTFLGFVRARHRVPEELPDRWPGHAYRLHARPERQIVGDGTLLVGDAAGLAHPVSGEGILAAVESGRLAARTILQAAGKYTRDRLEPYRASLCERYGRPGAAAGTSWPLPEALLSSLSARLLATRWFARHILLERWFLHRSLAPLQI